jgi:hypothetical protein
MPLTWIYSVPDRGTCEGISSTKTSTRRAKMARAFTMFPLEYIEYGSQQESSEEDIECPNFSTPKSVSADGPAV